MTSQMRGPDTDSKEAPGLTADSLEGLLARLSPDREEAARDYERLRVRLINYFRLKGLQDPSAAADLTFDRVAHLIPGDVINDIHKFCFGVARLVSLEQFRVEERRRISHEQYTNVGRQNGNVEGFYERLRHCFENLSPPDRALLEEYYRPDSAGARRDRRERLADREGITLSTLRLRVHRLRNTLRGCLRGRF